MRARFGVGILQASLLAALFPALSESSSINANIFTCRLPGGPSTNVTAPLSASVTLGVTLAPAAPGGCAVGGSDLVGAVDASLATARMRLSADNPLNLAIPSQFAGADYFGGITGGATIQDSVVISGGSGNGTLLMPWSIDGTLEAGGRFRSLFTVWRPLGPPGAAQIMAVWQACGEQALHDATTGCDGFAFPGQVSPLSLAVHETVTLSFPFVFDAPFTTSVFFGGLIGFAGAVPGSFAGSGLVAFDHTASLLPLVILDSNGNLIGGSVTSDSGFQYSVVPEPATILLLGSGLIAAARARRIFPRA